MLPTASARNRTDDLVTIDSENLFIHSTHSLFPSSSRTLSDNDDSYGGSKTKDTFRPADNIPMHPIQVEPRAHSDADTAISIVHTSNTPSLLGSIGSCGPLRESDSIAKFIWPIIPDQIPRYTKTRIM